MDLDRFIDGRERQYNAKVNERRRQRRRRQRRLPYDVARQLNDAQHNHRHTLHEWSASKVRQRIDKAHQRHVERERARRLEESHRAVIGVKQRFAGSYLTPARSTAQLEPLHASTSNTSSMSLAGGPVSTMATTTTTTTTKGWARVLPPLMQAIEAKHWARSLRLLVADPSAARKTDSHGALPLHAASAETATPVFVIKALLAAHPAAVRTHNKWGFSPLHLALQSSAPNSGTVELLRQHSHGHHEYIRRRKKQHRGSRKSQSLRGPGQWPGVLAATPTQYQKRRRGGAGVGAGTETGVGDGLGPLHSEGDAGVSGDGGLAKMRRRHKRYQRRQQRLLQQRIQEGEGEADSDEEVEEDEASKRRWRKLRRAVVSMPSDWPTMSQMRRVTQAGPMTMASPSPSPHPGGGGERDDQQQHRRSSPERRSSRAGSGSRRRRTSSRASSRRSQDSRGSRRQHSRSSKSRSRSRSRARARSRRRVSSRRSVSSSRYSTGSRSMSDMEESSTSSGEEADATAVLHVAAANPAVDARMLQKLLAQHPAAVRGRNDILRVPLHTAIAAHASEAKVLLLLRAWPAAAAVHDDRHETALHMAVRCVSHIAVVRALIATHPDAARFQDLDQRVPLQLIGSVLHQHNNADSYHAQHKATATTTERKSAGKDTKDASKGGKKGHRAGSTKNDTGDGDGEEEEEEDEEDEEEKPFLVYAFAEVVTAVFAANVAAQERLSPVHALEVLRAVLLSAMAIHEPHDAKKLITPIVTRTDVVKLLGQKKYFSNLQATCGERLAEINSRLDLIYASQDLASSLGEHVLSTRVAHRLYRKQHKTKAQLRRQTVLRHEAHAATELLMAELRAEIHGSEDEEDDDDEAGADAPAKQQQQQQQQHDLQHNHGQIKDAYHHHSSSVVPRQDMKGFDLLFSQDAYKKKSISNNKARQSKAAARGHGQGHRGHLSQARDLSGGGKDLTAFLGVPEKALIHVLILVSLALKPDFDRAVSAVLRVPSSTGTTMPTTTNKTVSAVMGAEAKKSSTKTQGAASSDQAGEVAACPRAAMLAIAASIPHDAAGDRATSDDAAADADGAALSLPPKEKSPAVLNRQLSLSAFVLPTTKQHRVKNVAGAPPAGAGAGVGVGKDDNDDADADADAMIYLPAPVKTATRMYNKLELDHAQCRRPRSAHNLDVLRATVVFPSPEALSAAFSRFAAKFQVVRVKNGYADEPGFTGFRSCLVNFVFPTHDLSHMTHDNRTVYDLSRDLPAQARWQEHFGGLEAEHRRDCVLALRRLLSAQLELQRRQGDEQWSPDALAAAQASLAAASPKVRIVCEVQMLYMPYLTQGRLKSHLFYKIIRAEDNRALQRDFAGPRRHAHLLHQGEEGGASHHEGKSAHEQQQQKEEDKEKHATAGGKGGPRTTKKTLAVTTGSAFLGMSTKTVVTEGATRNLAKTHIGALAAERLHSLAKRQHEHQSATRLLRSIQAGQRRERRRSQRMKNNRRYQKRIRLLGDGAGAGPTTRAAAAAAAAAGGGGGAMGAEGKASLAETRAAPMIGRHKTSNVLNHEHHESYRHRLDSDASSGADTSTCSPPRRASRAPGRVSLGPKRRVRPRPDLETADSSTSSEEEEDDANAAPVEVAKKTRAKLPARRKSTFMGAGRGAKKK